MTSSYYKIEKFLSETMGLEPESVGKKTIREAVNAGMRSSKTDDGNHYLKILASAPDELEKVIEKVTIPETWFFRDRESFNFLKKYAGEIRSAGLTGKALRVLSIPCSTGEEPYSIAIALLQTGLLPEDFHIDAADISQKAIESAQQAIYKKGSFRGENKDYQGLYFTGTEEGYRLDRTIAGLVCFYKENFVQPHALSRHAPYHIIFCKNFLIYLTDDARKKVLANLGRLLLPGGLIFAGHSEIMTFLQNGYRPIKHARSFACTKDGVVEDSVLPGAGATKFWPRIVRQDIPALPDDNADAPVVPPRGEERGRIDLSANTLEDTRESKGLTKIRSLADKGKLKEASVLCEEFLTEHRGNKEAYCLMGTINFALNLFGKAEESFQKALYLDPYYYGALFHMSLLYEKKGDQAKASLMRERIKRFQENRANIENAEL